MTRRRLSRTERKPWQCAGCGEMTNRSHYHPADGGNIHEGQTTSHRTKLIETLDDAITDHGYWHVPQERIEQGLDAVLDYLADSSGLTYEVAQRVWGGSGNTPDAQEHIEILVRLLRGDGDGTS